MAKKVDIVNRPIRIVHQGQVATSEEFGALETTLGSCVAVVLIDEEKKTAGINHIFLPDPAFGISTDPLQYAEPAVTELVKRMESQGSLRKNLRAHLFGGAAIFAHHAINVGHLSVKKAEDTLNRFQIPIVKKNVGGPQGRQVRVHVPECEIFVKDLPSSIK